jgi:hypothetical protein
VEKAEELFSVVPKVHRFTWLSRSKVLGRRFVVSLRRSPPKSTLLIGAQYVGIQNMRTTS